MPVLADQQRRGQDRDDDLHDEDHRGDLRGRAPLQGAHLGQQADPGDQACRGDPQQHRPGATLLQRVGGELGRQSAPGQRGAGPERHQPAEAASGEGRQREDGDPAQDGRHRAAARVPGGDVGRDDGQQRDSREDGQDGQRLARADLLVEVARPDDQQQDQPEGQRGLDDGQRREQQRGRLQRPAEQVQARPEQPATPAHQAHQQRRAQAFAGWRFAHVERLERQADVVERRRPARGTDPEDDRGHGQLPF
jgi:hypothetical protein